MCDSKKKFAKTQKAIYFNKDSENMNNARWKARKELKTAYTESDETFSCPFCDYEEFIELERHCTIIHCPNCGYNYCINCEYIYDPEPNWLEIFKLKSVEEYTVIFDYNVWEFKPKSDDCYEQVTRILFGIKGEFPLNVLKEKLTEFVHKNSNYNVIPLELVLDFFKPFANYYKIDKNYSTHGNYFELEMGDGIYLRHTEDLFTCYPFF